MTQLSLHLLGPLTIAVGPDAPGTFESDKVRALLCYLAVESDQAHRRSALAELFWPERPERSALLNLNQALANLRKALGEQQAAVPLLLVDRNSIQFNQAAHSYLDLAEFYTLIETSAQHNHRDPAGCSACAERLTQALVLYRGEVLAQFAPRDSLPFQEWALLLRERTHRLASEALDQLVAYHERRGDQATLLQLAYRQIELDPWREDAHRLVMRLLWQDGQRSAAIAQYERCRELLTADLGIEPDAETTALYQQIRGAASPEEPPAPAAHVSELPQPTTPFFGRAQELAQIAEYLATPGCRLVTIVGLGGSGKTRLALQAAQSQGPLFAAGVSFVSLAPLASLDHLAATIAQRLGIQLDAAPNDLELLGAALRGQQMLLVLDNLEHLEGVAAAIAQLIEYAPELTILATSRQRLGLRAEWTLDIDGLGLPESVSETALNNAAATALFIQAARRAHAHVSFDLSERQAILTICRSLGGHPLGIELAAAWVRVLSCADIASELAASIELLHSPADDLPARHRTIRAVFTATWRLLPANERQIMQRLAVCRGGFDRTAASKITGASLLQLAALSNKALLIRDRSGRYAMHEFVRQYAQEQLDASGEAKLAAQQHAEYYFALVDQAEPFMKGPDETIWMDRLELEHANLRVALEHTLSSGELRSAARACEVLRWFWYIRGHIGEGRTWMERVLRELDRVKIELPYTQEAKILQGAGIFADEQGDYVQAGQRYNQAIAVYTANGDQRGIQATTNSLGMLAWSRGDYAGAQACFERSLALCRELQHNWGMANALNSLGTAVQAQGDLERARGLYLESLEVARTTGYEQLVTLALDNLGEVALALGDFPAARAALSEALARQQAVADTRGAALSLQALGMLALTDGDLTLAEEQLFAGLEVAWRLSNRRELTTYVDNLAALFVRQGHYSEAVQLCASTHQLRQRIGSPLTAMERANVEKSLEIARNQLTPNQFQAAWISGTAANFDELLGAIFACREN